MAVIYVINIIVMDIFLHYGVSPCIILYQAVVLPLHRQQINLPDIK